VLQQRLDLELAAVPLGVPAARGAVTRLCRELRITDAFADDVRQAVTEACINFVVRDCHDAPRDRTFLLKVAVTDESLLVVVQGATCFEDRGAARSQEPADLQLIDPFADEVAVSLRPGGRMRLAMRFAMSRRSAGASRSKAA
jgi:anti-sigma regulatory factor (Ser/Thr protein kinase)